MTKLVCIGQLTNFDLIIHIGRNVIFFTFNNYKIENSIGSVEIYTYQLYHIY